ncbi:MAG: ComEC/Rec2 family competence protein, partial [Alphaproteobacteria bacterium]
LAAFVVLILQPEALISVSFQMSFAAVIALVAAYEGWRAHEARHGFAQQRGAWVRTMRYFQAVIFSTLVAEAAINPLSVYHFNQLALYGIAGNLVAIPLTSLWIMPWGVAAFLLMPLGWEAAPLWLMGQGIELLLATARNVAAAPGAVLILPTPPFASLLLFVAGGLWLCLWRTRLRLLGLAVIAAAAMPILWAKTPDMLVADSGQPVAVRGEDGRLLLSSRGGQRFVRESWLRREGARQARRWMDDLAWQARHQAICDALGCALRLGPAGDRLAWRLALPADAAAFAEDCRHADILVTALPAPKACPAPMLIIDAARLAHEGGHAVYFTMKDGTPGLRVETVAAARGRRPWVPGAMRRTTEPGP